MAAPCTAATTGSGAAKSRSAASYNAAMSWSALPAKSRPAQKCRPSDASTIARHQPDLSSSSYAVAMRSRRSVSKKLLGGRRKVTTPTCVAVLLHRDVGPAHRAAPFHVDVLQAAPVDHRVLAVDGFGHPSQLLEAELAVHGADRVGLEDQVEHHGVEAEAARLAQRVLHQGPPHTGAPVRRRHEIAGVGDVRGAAHEIRLDVRGTDQVAAEAGHRDRHRMADPVLVEVLAGDRRLLRETLAGAHNATERRVELVVVVGRRSADLYGHAPTVVVPTWEPI